MYEDGAELTREQIDWFVERMDSGEEVEAGSDVHRMMTAASERAMRMTSRMNAQFDSLSDAPDNCVVAGVPAKDKGTGHLSGPATTPRTIFALNSGG